MKTCISDPVLIKADHLLFITEWNKREESEDVFQYASNQDQLANLLMRINDATCLDASVLSPIERYFEGKKLARKARRRHSVLQANHKEQEIYQELRRSQSHPVVATPRRENSDEKEGQKRVSFSMTEEEETAKKEQENKYRKKRPITEEAVRPILVRKTRAASTPQSHMDFATFMAWRRGSRMEEDVLQCESDRTSSTKRWSATEFLKGLLLPCLASRRNRTSPQKDSKSMRY